MSEARIDLTVASEEVSSAASQGTVPQPTNPTATSTTPSGLTPEQIASKALTRKITDLERRAKLTGLKAESRARMFQRKVPSSFSRVKRENISAEASNIKERANNLLDQTLSSVLDNLELVRQEAVTKNKPAIAQRAKSAVNKLTKQKLNLLNIIASDVDVQADTAFNQKAAKEQQIEADKRLSKRKRLAETEKRNRQKLQQSYDLKDAAEAQAVAAAEAELQRLGTPKDKDQAAIFQNLVNTAYRSTKTNVLRQGRLTGLIPGGPGGPTGSGGSGGTGGTGGGTSGGGTSGGAGGIPKVPVPKGGGKPGILAVFDVFEILADQVKAIRDLTLSAGKEVRQALVEGSTAEGLNTARAFSGAGNVAKQAQVVASGVGGAAAGAILGTTLFPGLGTIAGGIAGAGLGAGAGSLLGELIPNPVAIFGEMVSLLSEIAENTANQARMFSGDLIASKLNAQIKLLEQNIQRADYVGNILAQIENAQTDLNMEFAKLTDTIIKEFGPYLTSILEYLTEIVKVARFVDISPKELLDIIAGAINPVLFGYNAYNTVKKIITEAVAEAAKRIKDEEQASLRLGDELAQFFDTNDLLNTMKPKPII